MHVSGLSEFPRGEITEIVGRLSSGRTSLFVAGLATATRRGALAALVDTDDAFDPVSAARAGVELGRVLWVRCGGRRDLALRAADLLVRCPGFALVGLDVGETPPRLPLAHAFRLRLAVRRTGAALVIVGCSRIAGASAGLALETVRSARGWSGPAGRATRLAGARSTITVLRARGALRAGVDAQTSWTA
jgi:recombination protein RecA